MLISVLFYVAVSEGYEMYRKVLSAEESFIRSRRVFASLVNAVCYNGKKTVEAGRLEEVSHPVFDEMTIKRIFPYFIRCVTMHSPAGDIKLIQLKGKNQG